MPQLTGWVLAFDVVEMVFEGGVAAAELGLEGKVVAESGKVERFARGEDDGLFGKVPV